MQCSVEIKGKFGFQIDKEDESMEATVNTEEMERNYIYVHTAMYTCGRLKKDSNQRNCRLDLQPTSQCDVDLSSLRPVHGMVITLMVELIRHIHCFKSEILTYG